MMSSLPVRAASHWKLPVLVGRELLVPGDRDRTRRPMLVRPLFMGRGWIRHIWVSTCLRTCDSVLENRCLAGCGGSFLNPSIQKTEAGGSWVRGQPGLLSETLSQKRKKGRKERKRKGRKEGREGG
jgi:hypothetical protein